MGAASLGSSSGVHSIAVDSKGDIFTTETYEGKRVQRFAYQGMKPVERREQGTPWPASARWRHPRGRRPSPLLHASQRGPWSPRGIYPLHSLRKSGKAHARCRYDPPPYPRGTALGACRPSRQRCWALKSSRPWWPTAAWSRPALTVWCRSKLGLRLGLGLGLPLPLPLPLEVPGIQLDRRCGGGLQAIVTAAMMVQTGAADCVLAGGVESMSNIEYYTTALREALEAGNVALYDRLERGRELPARGALWG